MEKLRIDKWLWAARFYKTRALATKAVTGGHVHVEGVRVKPSREIKLGEIVEIKKSSYLFKVTVVDLSARRGSASMARQLYEEDEPSRLAREELAAQRRMQQASDPSPKRRPDKRERRHIIRFINKNQE